MATLLKSKARNRPNEAANIFQSTFVRSYYAVEREGFEVCFTFASPGMRSSTGKLYTINSTFVGKWSYQNGFTNVPGQLFDQEKFILARLRSICYVDESLRVGRQWVP